MPIRKSKTPITWERRLTGYFVAFCRRTFHWSPAYKEALKRAFVEKRNGLEYYQCELCKRVVERGQKQVDHKIPVVSVSDGFQDWNTYRDRLFCTAENLAILCRPCHAVKTKQENAERHRLKTGCYSAESKAKMSSAQKGHTYLRGIPKSLEHRKAMSEERKSKVQTAARKMAQQKTAEAQRRSVIAVDIYTQAATHFDSIEEAARSLGLDATNISRVCRQDQGRTQTGGYRFYFN